MFCAKTHNMGFVSPADNKTPIVPLQGAALRDCRKRQGGFAIRESCAHPLTHLPAKMENTSRVFVSAEVGLLRELTVSAMRDRIRNAERSVSDRSHIRGGFPCPLLFIRKHILQKSRLGHCCLKQNQLAG